MTAYRPIPTPGAVPNTTSYRGASGHWTERAACDGADTDMFFPAEGQGAINPWEVENVNRKFCAPCPVRDACFVNALVANDRVGIRGGVDMATVPQRTRERRLNELRATGTAGLPRRRAATTRNPAEPATPPGKPGQPGRAKPVNRLECGTRAGYATHTAEGERQCAPCQAWKAAMRRASVARNAGRTPMPVQPLDLAELQHLAAQGADIHRAALTAGRTPKALERALQRCGQHKLAASLRRAA